MAPTESEQVFFNRPVLVTTDERHSGQEARFAALGRTSAERHLAVVFTIRGDAHQGDVGPGHEPAGTEGV